MPGIVNDPRGDAREEVALGVITLRRPTSVRLMAKTSWSWASSGDWKTRSSMVSMRSSNSLSRGKKLSTSASTTAYRTKAALSVCRW